MNGKSPKTSTAPPFVLRLSKEERRVFQQNHNSCLTLISLLGDAFRQDQLAQGLMKRGDLSDKLIEKILSENPRRLYSIDRKIKNLNL
jgi:hypothetical protein